jgi:hypothetical protein
MLWAPRICRHCQNKQWYRTRSTSDFLNNAGTFASVFNELSRLLCKSKWITGVG